VVQYEQESVPAKGVAVSLSNGWREADQNGWQEEFYMLIPVTSLAESQPLLHLRMGLQLPSLCLPRRAS
jgi:hypothetical protein